jgi:flagellar biosynthesis/type III secretory pathway protein FliH
VEFVETYVPLAEQEQAQFQQLVRSGEDYEKVEQMITSYEKEGIKKGKQEGKQEGIKEGIEKGIREGSGGAN